MKILGNSKKDVPETKNNQKEKILKIADQVLGEIDFNQTVKKPLKIREDPSLAGKMYSTNPRPRSDK